MSNEATLVATPSHRADERFKAIVVTLMSLVTILSALVAFLQNDASNRSSTLLRDGQRIGHNTDWSGFAEAFRRAMPDAPRRRVVQLGAGGAGSAVA